jgi:hypothetical protein
MQFTTTNQQRPTGDVTALAILSKCRDSSVTLMPAMSCRRRMTGIALHWATRSGISTT